ncbi:hypothetical protein D4764_03G0001160 [Takifugu flavidus]|uniref:Uncharacterized protein n=1 Tax=Takifugu flavidus TaxID=433684 RepID=A0A5C6N8K4_9TELE|nr:hypothetical protein D4764_03G0001160 [Takifugu flavidus]
MFRNGSVINDMMLSFDRTSVPHHTEIANVLINASLIVIGFDIEGSSISVDGIVLGKSRERQRRGRLTELKRSTSAALTSSDVP